MTVKHVMRTSWKQLKVFNAAIGSVAVLVVNNLTRLELAPKMLLHNKSVNEENATSHLCNWITLLQINAARDFNVGSSANSIFRCFRKMRPFLLGAGKIGSPTPALVMCLAIAMSLMLCLATTYAAPFIPNRPYSMTRAIISRASNPATTITLSATPVLASAPKSHVMIAAQTKSLSDAGALFTFHHEVSIACFSGAM